MVVDRVVIKGVGDTKTIVGSSTALQSCVEEQLIRWCPVADEFVDRRRSCLGFFELEHGTYSLTKTTCFSNSVDGLNDQTVSIALLLDTADLDLLKNNSAIFAFMAESNGGLFCDWDANEELSAIEVSSSNVFDPRRWATESTADEWSHVLRAVEIHSRIAVSGYSNAHKFLAGLLTRLPRDQRLGLSFSIGSFFSPDRPFKVQLFPEFDDRIRSILAAEQVRSITLNQAVVAG